MPDEESRRDRIERERNVKKKKFSAFIQPAAPNRGGGDARKLKLIYGRREKPR